MVRRRDDEDTDVSLFPFLSILACIIGTLTLMITALALGQMDTKPVADAEEFENLVKQNKKILAQTETLKEQLRLAANNSTGKVQELAKSQTILAQLQQQLKKIEDENKDIETVAPEKVAIDYDAKLKQLQTEKNLLDEKVNALQSELTKRIDAKEAVVQVRPGGTGVDFVPTFVECIESGIVVYTDEEEPHRVSRANIGSDVKFLKLLDEIAEDEQRVITLLLREDAVATYYRARDVAR